MSNHAKARRLIGIIKFVAFKLTDEEICKLADVIEEALNRIEKECMEGLKDGNK